MGKSFNSPASPHVAVGKFVAAESSRSQKDQSIQNERLQSIQNKAFANYIIQEISKEAVTWFGTRGSELQIFFSPEQMN